MKPIMPVTATPAPTPMATMSTIAHLTAPTGTPRCRALPSPSNMAFRLLARSGSTTRLTPMKGKTLITLPQLAPPIEPSCQKTIVRSCASVAI
ncbi:hypothetical protein D3C72_2388810 [compost metagenome]